MATAMISANATQPAPAQVQPQAATESAQNPFGDQQRALTFAAAGRDAMSLVEAARFELTQDNAAEARANLERASTILGEVQQGLESQPLTASTNADKQDVISIFAQLGVSSDANITDDMRAQLQEISGHIALGEHEKVVAGLEGLGIPAVYQYVEMPVGSTLGQVKTAMAAIDAEEMDKAVEGIQAATDTLHSDFVRIGMDDQEQTG